MPVGPCHHEGKPGFRWGSSGKCYTYEPGDERARSAARARAEAQGRAAHASGYGKQAGSPLAAREGAESLARGIVGIKEVLEKASDDLEPEEALKLLHQAMTESATSVDRAWQRTMGKAIQQFGSRQYTTGAQVADGARRLVQTARRFVRGKELEAAWKEIIEASYAFGVLHVWARRNQLLRRQNEGGKVPEAPSASTRPVEKAKPAAAKITAGVNFTIEDENAIANLWSGGRTAWITNDRGMHVMSSAVQNNVRNRARELINRGVTGEALSAALRDDMSRWFGTGIADFATRGRAYWGGVIEHVATESAIRGQLMEMRRLGFTRYEVVNPMDERTTPICQMMNGKVLIVNDAIELHERVSAARTPEAVKEAKPFASGGKATAATKVVPMTVGDKTLTPEQSSELAKAGMAVPPYHFRCRSYIDVFVGEGETVPQPVVQPTPPSGRPAGGTLPPAQPTAQAPEVPEGMVDTPIGPMKPNARGETPYTARYGSGQSRIVPDGRFDEDKMKNAMNRYDGDKARDRYERSRGWHPERGTGPTRQEQEIRRQMANLVGEYGCISSDLQWKLTDAGRLVLERRDGALAVHTWKGSINIRPDYFDKAKALVNGERTRSAMDGMSTLVHEALHGCSHTSSMAYRGAGRVIEEVSTELGARFIMYDKWGFVETSASYQRYINKTIEAVDRALRSSGVRAKTGMERIYGRMEHEIRIDRTRPRTHRSIPSYAESDTVAGMVTDTSLAMKRASRVGRSKHGIDTPQKLVEQFVDEFPVPSEITEKGTRAVNKFKRDLKSELMSLEP